MIEMCENKKIKTVDEEGKSVKGLPSSQGALKTYL
jgi:hypothetical protein